MEVALDDSIAVAAAVTVVEAASVEDVSSVAVCNVFVSAVNAVEVSSGAGLVDCCTADSVSSVIPAGSAVDSAASADWCTFVVEEPRKAAADDLDVL